MARYYLDTSVLLFRYFHTADPRASEQERSGKIQGFIRRVMTASGPIPAVSLLTLLEARGILARRARSHPELSPALDLLDVDEERLEIWEPRMEDWSRAMDLAVGDALGGADALHLAMFLRAREKHSDLVLATSDHDLIRACRTRELAHLDPESVPPAR